MVVELLNHMGDDLMIVNAARVSFNKESDWDAKCNADCLEHGHHPSPECPECEKSLSERDAKLINYLVTHKHWTPLGHPHLQFRFKMAIPMAREWYRHTIGLVRSEISRRYVDSDPDYFYPEYFRKRDKNLKQGSLDEVNEHNEGLMVAYDTYMKMGDALYKDFLDKGVPPEQARFLLSQAMNTEFIETGSLAAYARIYGLRYAPDAQAEIREYARQLGELIEPLFPVSWAALTKST